MLGTRENKIGVSRTSSVFGGSRTRSVLGRSVLGGDDLDGGADELPAATMGVISPMLRHDFSNASGSTISPMLVCVDTSFYNLHLTNR
nr:hypothetical protein CFP56_29275 [Quercus suber]